MLKVKISSIIEQLKSRVAPIQAAIIEAKKPGAQDKAIANAVAWFKDPKKAAADELDASILDVAAAETVVAKANAQIEAYSALTEDSAVEVCGPSDIQALYNWVTPVDKLPKRVLRLG